MKQHHLGFLQGARILIILWISLADSHGARADHRNKPGTSMKGAEQLMHLNRPEQALDLKTGDTVAMACSMCKNIAVLRVEKNRGREFLTPGTRHGCSMCGGTIEITGQRMDKREIIRHTCTQCGENSAYCCATRRRSKASPPAGEAHSGHHEPAGEKKPEKKPEKEPKDQERPQTP
jgi:hypothetical protein